MTNTVEVSSRGLAILFGVTFGTGVVVGWYFKEMRIRYLKKKKEFYLSRLANTRKQIDAETS